MLPGLAWRSNALCSRNVAIYLVVLRLTPNPVSDLGCRGVTAVDDTSSLPIMSGFARLLLHLGIGVIMAVSLPHKPEVLS